jgi:flagellar basal-body rod modification protein FlgD
MAINALNGTRDTSYEAAASDQSVLGKDDFMKLLLAELQHQDPTSPMDSDKILAQTSQLAQLESQDKTNKALEQLTASFANSKNFSAVSAIGKMARMSNEVKLKNTTDGKPSPVNFTMDFDEDIKSGTIYIYDDKNRLTSSMDIDPKKAGGHSFTWDGKTTAGGDAKSGEYKIIAKYQNEDGLNLEGKFGAYKIEAVKFEDEKTFVKVNGSYTDFTNVAELFEDTKKEG